MTSMKVNLYGLALLLTSFGLSIADVTSADAEAAALLWRGGSGLSLADRLCLALAARLDLPAATTDAEWQHADTVATVRLIR